MGQKSHPKSLRVGYSEDWQSRWLNQDEYADYLWEDYQIREFLHERFKSVGVSMIEIERLEGEVVIDIHTARPGVIIGRGGSGIEKLRETLEGEIIEDDKIRINIHEVDNAESDAALIASQIVEKIERRIPFRRAVKGAMSNALDQDIDGIRISIAGRLNGSDISRTENFSHGTVPLHTLRKKIDYAFREAKTKFGTIGVKVWVFRGEEVGVGEEMEMIKEKLEDEDNNN